MPCLRLPTAGPTHRKMAGLLGRGAIHAFGSRAHGTLCTVSKVYGEVLPTNWGIRNQTEKPSGRDVTKQPHLQLASWTDGADTVWPSRKSLSSVLDMIFLRVQGQVVVTKAYPQCVLPNENQRRSIHLPRCSKYQNLPQSMPLHPGAMAAQTLSLAASS